MQTANTVKTRRLGSSAVREPKDAYFALPPPPTKSTKLIQMKPRPKEQALGASCIKENGQSESGATGNVGNTVENASEGKRGNKQLCATSAMGCKVTRKTAHNLIETRRRRKMKDEFATLKSMIPACTRDTQKLAILQVRSEKSNYTPVVPPAPNN